MKDTIHFSGRNALICFCVVAWAMLMMSVPANAAVTISGTVKDNTGTAVVGATVQAVDSGSQQVVASTQTDSNGAYSLSVDPGTYDVRVIPPAGSGFGSAVAPSRQVTADTVVNFVLVPTGLAALSGRVMDALGNGVPNQTVMLRSASGYIVVSPGH